MYQIPNTPGDWSGAHALKGQSSKAQGTALGRHPPSATRTRRGGFSKFASEERPFEDQGRDWLKLLSPTDTVHRS